MPCTYIPWIGRSELLALARQLGWPAVQYWSGSLLQGRQAWEEAPFTFPAARRQAWEQLQKIATLGAQR